MKAKNTISSEQFKFTWKIAETEANSISLRTYTLQFTPWLRNSTYKSAGVKLALLA